MTKNLYINFARIWCLWFSLLCCTGFSQHLGGKKHVTIGLFAQNFTKDSSVVTAQYLLTRHCTMLSGSHVIQSCPVSLDIMFRRTEQVYCTIKMTTIFLRQITMSWTTFARFISYLIKSAFEKHLPYLLTPWCRVLLEKLTGSQLLKKFPAFYGTRRFITAFTSARHLSLPWVRSIQSLPPHPTSWRSYCPPIYAWIFQVVSYSQVSPPKPWIHLSSPPYVLHAPPISFLLKENCTIYSGRLVVQHSLVKLTKCKNTSFW